MAEALQRPDAGERIERGPNDVVMGISLCEYRAPPDPSPPLHVHEETDQVLYVPDGALECAAADDTFTAEVGATVTISRGGPFTRSQ